MQQHGWRAAPCSSGRLQPTCQLDSTTAPRPSHTSAPPPHAGMATMLRSLTLTAMPRYQASRAKSACRVGSTCLLWSAEFLFCLPQSAAPWS